MALRVRATFLEEQTEGAQMAALNRSRSAPGLTSTQTQHQEVCLQIERLYCKDLSSKIAASCGSRKTAVKASATACSGGHPKVSCIRRCCLPNTPGLHDMLSQASTSTQAGSDSDHMEASDAPRAPCRRRRGGAAPAKALATNEALAKSMLLSKAAAKTSTEASTGSSGNNSMRLGTPAASQTTRSKRWADMAEDSDCDTFNFEVKSLESSSSLSSSLSRPAPSSPALEEKAADDELEALRSAMNAGSWGHPELCSRPCLYFAAGVCANAKDCDYCHLPHSKRPAHLDKRQRSELEQTSPSEWAALVVPILESRVGAVDASEEASQLVAAVAKQCQCGGNACRSAPPRGQRVLMLTLRAMSLRALISTMLRSGATHGFDLNESLEALMNRLRSSTAAVNAEPQQSLTSSENMTGPPACWYRHRQSKGLSSLPVLNPSLPAVGTSPLGNQTLAATSLSAKVLRGCVASASIGHGNMVLTILAETSGGSATDLYCLV